MVQNFSQRPHCRGGKDTCRDSTCSEGREVPARVGGGGGGGGPAAEIFKKIIF